MNAPLTDKFQKKSYLPTWPRRVQFGQPKGTQGEEINDIGLVIITTAVIAVILIATALLLSMLAATVPAESEHLWMFAP